ncbi:MAG: M67 family peptidase [Candidatus Manganitrophaceae bacterium]|nr:MAG: M67 family peptidase [Candidatus Manganitrophaceae bacterium]
MFQISNSMIDQLIAHAQAEAPNECCGLLAGKEGVVSEMYQIANLPAEDPAIADLKVPPDRRFRYVMDPKEQLRAFKEMRKGGTELLAIYHSHPHSPAYPSATDVRLAFYADVHYLIISLEKEKPMVRAFRIIDQKITEANIEVSS